MQFEVRKEAEKGKMKIPLVPQNKLGNFQGSLVNGPIGMKNIMTAKNIILDSQKDTITIIESPYLQSVSSPFLWHRQTVE